LTPNQKFFNYVQIFTRSFAFPLETEGCRFALCLLGRVCTISSFFFFGSYIFLNLLWDETLLDRRIQLDYVLFIFTLLRKGCEVKPKMHLLGFLSSDINFFMSLFCERTTPTLLLQIGFCWCPYSSFVFGENVNLVTPKTMKWGSLCFFYARNRFFSFYLFTIIPITCEL